MREALDRSSYSTAHRVRHCLPTRGEGGTARRYPWLPPSPFSRFAASLQGFFFITQGKSFMDTLTLRESGESYAEV